MFAIKICLGLIISEQLLRVEVYLLKNSIPVIIFIFFCNKV